jgi:hypothetical protein
MPFSKVKLSHYIPWRRLGEKRLSSYPFLTSELNGGEWSGTRPGRVLPPGKDRQYPLGRRLAIPQTWSGHRG